MFESCFELKEAFERLFQRPDKLKLVIGEMFPATRTVEQDVESAEMDGVEHLGQYVYEMTQAKIASLKAGTETLPLVDKLDEMTAIDEEDMDYPEEDGNPGEDDVNVEEAATVLPEVME